MNCRLQLIAGLNLTIAGASGRASLRRSVFGSSPAEIVGSSPAEGMSLSLSLSECWVLSGRGLRDGSITRPEESY